MAGQTWVAKADDGVHFGVQIGAVRRRTNSMTVEFYEEPLRVILNPGRLVASLGFDRLLVFDHAFVMTDPWTGVSALEMIIVRVMLGSVVNCVYYRHLA